MKEIDARGLECPKPVILAKKAIEEGVDEFAILVNRDSAKENVSRLAKKMGFETELQEGVGFHKLVAKRSGVASCEIIEKINDSVIFVVSDKIGRGNEELGGVLARSFFNSLPDAEILPAKIVFMNDGVKLTCAGSPVIDSLRNVEGLGVTLLVCGTCLDFFGLKEKLEVGTVSNMLEIQQSFIEAGNVITI